VHTRALLVAAGSILASALLAGCGANSADIQQLNQNQFTLRGMIASDRQQIDSLQVQVRRLRDEIAELKHAGAAGGPGAGQMSSVNDRLAKLETEVNAMQAAMPTIPTAPPTGAAAPTAPGVPPAAGAGAAPVAPAGPSPTWPQELDSELQAAKNSRAQGARLYREGLLAMKSGNYPSAIVKFARLQHNYPKSPLCEPAEYFAANALYESGKPDRAILQFNDVVMRFPRGRFTSQSLLREAEAFLKLDDKIDARLTLQKLIADHPGTPQATAAAQMMKRLVAD
jgi:tol-pal system protein YbgF